MSGGTRTATHEVPGGWLRADLRTDVCIIGAGPAGIAVALSLLHTGLEIVVLESGTMEASKASQSLNQGEVVGDPYAGLVATRHRGWGGTTRLWNTPVAGVLGAKYVPLDPVDLLGRSSGGAGAWPLEWAELRGWYEDAQVLCGLGPFVYEGDAWATDARPCLPLPPERLVNRVYQFGSSHVFTEARLATLSKESNVRIFDRSTVCGLPGIDASGRTHRAEVAGPDGERFSVRARAFVLCGGAVENARILLASSSTQRSADDVPGNAGGWVGRGFMEHPRDRSMIWMPTTPDLYRRTAFYDRHDASDGTVIGGRIGLSENAVARFGNASLTLLPRLSPPTARQRWQTRLRAFGLPLPRSRRGGYGWSAVDRPERVFEGLQVLINLEQAPNVENQVTLSDTVDRYGVPRPVLHWQWRPGDQRRLDALRDWVREGLEATALGRVEQVEIGPPDPNAHHHAGTTRMHPIPNEGVVTPDCRVHGTDDLYVAGASVFPSAGFANPTLTIVALSIRLGAGLAARLA